MDWTEIVALGIVILSLAASLVNAIVAAKSKHGRVFHAIAALNIALFSVFYFLLLIGVIPAPTVLSLIIGRALLLPLMAILLIQGILEVRAC